MARRTVDPHELRAAVDAVRGWLVDDGSEPSRAELATAVRLSLRTMAQHAPGNSVEVRVPPFAVVQCIAGPSHTRGTPPNTIETDAKTWLQLTIGVLSWRQAVSESRVTASGIRADLSDNLPLLRLR